VPELYGALRPNSDKKNLAAGFWDEIKREIYGFLTRTL
jgi:hypothetical protein